MLPPEEPNQNKSVTEHGQRLMQVLQAQRQFVGCQVQGAQELSENNDHKTGNDGQKAQADHRRMGWRRLGVSLMDDLKPDKNENGGNNRARNEADKQRHQPDCRTDADQQAGGQCVSPGCAHFFVRRMASQV